MTAPVEWTGRREQCVNGVTPEKLALLVEMLPDALSLRDIALLLGLRLDTVRRAAAPFLAIMKLSGTHPKCGCGKDRFHSYGCSANFAKSDRGGLLPGCSRERSAELLSKRRVIIDAILAGETYASIEQRLSLPQKTARKYLRFMTPEQLAIRKEMEAKRAYRPCRSRGKREADGPGSEHRPQGSDLAPNTRAAEPFRALYRLESGCSSRSPQGASLSPAAHHSIARIAA